jgi:hypothetical protein
MLRASATAIGHSLGLQPGDISARALRAGVAMALLLGKLDYATIQLIRRWRSNQILWYLHFSACPIMQCHASIMTQYADFQQFPAPAFDLVDKHPPARSHLSFSNTHSFLYSCLAPSYRWALVWLPTAAQMVASTNSLGEAVRVRGRLYA